VQYAAQARVSLPGFGFGGFDKAAPYLKLKITLTLFYPARLIRFPDNPRSLGEAMD